MTQRAPSSTILIALTTFALAGCASGPRVAASAPRGGSLRSTSGAQPGKAATAPQETAGDPAPDLLTMLQENGSLTPEQVESLRTAGGAADREGAGEEEGSGGIGPRGLVFTSADEDYSMRIGGRLHLDGNVHGRESGSDETQVQDGTEIRRARFEMRGTLPEDMAWWAEVDFANNKVSLKDFRFQQDLEGDQLVSIGHQKQPYSLAVEESSNDMPFLERSIDNYLVIPFVDRAIGVRYQGHSESTFWAAGLFGESVSPEADDDEGYGAVARLVHAPVVEDDRILHLGVRGAYRTPEDGSESIRLRDETTNMSNFAVVDTGTISGVDSITLYGPELAWVHGPLSFGGELNFMDVDVAGENLGFDSWHVYTAYSLTGESRARAYRLDEGEFKRLSAEGPSGHAWELALRLAELDLTDGRIDGGKERAANLALNCYWSEHVRFMFNWTHILDTDGGSAATAAAEGDDIFTIRAQLTF